MTVPRRTRKQAIKELMECKANINYVDPKILLREFMAEYGPVHTDYILAAVIDVIKANNDEIMTLRRQVRKLQRGLQ